jgi:spore germination cell wall hydrolase CwlJ-like protein
LTTPSTNKTCIILNQLTQALLIVLSAAAVTAGMSWSISKKFERLEADRQAVAQLEPTAAERLKALECLTRNIYWEAASESFEGKVAVAQVTLNRVESDRFPNTVCGVVYQKNIFYQRVVCQFSWFCEANHRIRPVHAAMYRESEEVAKKVLLEGFRLPGLRDALFYHATYISPGWRNEKIVTIGQHIFYK